MDKVQQLDAQDEEPNRQNELISAMLKPSFYPNCPAGITHKETHISHLFFAGELVYKIKKGRPIFLYGLHHARQAALLPQRTADS